MRICKLMYFLVSAGEQQSHLALREPTPVSGWQVRGNLLHAKDFRVMR
jgi:hypothetical protein